MRQRTALVTNALEFAGSPAVAALLQAGLRVVAHDRAFAESAALEAYRGAHPQVVAIAAQDPREIIDSSNSESAPLAVLVSNDAWPPVHTPIAEAHLEDLRATLDQLLIFPFTLIQAAIPALVAAQTARVVMITSNRTRLQQAGGAIPDMARAGLNALVKSLSLELAPHGIPVNAIAPNFLYSETYYPRARFIDDPAGREFVRRSVPMGRLGQPEEVGEVVRFLATMQGNFMTGAIMDFSGGWPAALPRPG